MRRMRRVISIVGLLFAVVLTIGACGGGEGDQSSTPGTTQTAGTLPEQPGESLSPGKYAAKEFHPGFSFRVGEGWKSSGPDIREHVAIERSGDAFLGLGFSNPQQVYDPKKPIEQRKVPAPDTVDGWVDWYQQNPHLEVSHPEPASIGGATGVTFDTRAISAPENSAEVCGTPCVPAFPVGDSAADFYLGDREKTFVLKVSDETVIVSIATLADEFEEFLPKAQEVLDTVEWTENG